MSVKIYLLSYKEFKLALRWSGESEWDDDMTEIKLSYFIFI